MSVSWFAPDPSDVIIIEDSGNSSEGHEMSLKLTLSCESDSGDTVPPSYERDSELPNSEWSSIDETRVLNKLSEELEGLIRVTDSYMVHIYLKDDNKFKAASNIMEVRCPLLLKEAKDRVIMWPKVNSCTCEAFFTYLYSGSLSRVRNLSSEDLWLVDSLCVKYEVDLLHKFIKSLTPRGEMSSHENSDLEIINTSVTQLSQSPGSPDLFDNEIEPDGMPKHSVGFVCISSQSNSPSHIEPPPSPPIIVTASTSNAHSSRCQTNSTISPLVKDCQTPHGQRIVSSEATPMPNYHSLLTPELKRELDKYGLKKGLDRKKAINLLSYIYEQIHPHKRDPIVQRAIIETQERLLRAGETDTDSASSSDSFASTSEEPSDNEPDEVVAMTIDDRDRVLRRISRFIKENEEFHVAILKYEPIQLEKLRASLKENAVPHSKPVLKFVLDELGIDYTIENNEDNNSRKRRRKQRKC